MATIHSVLSSSTIAALSQAQEALRVHEALAPRLALEHRIASIAEIGVLRSSLVEFDQRAFGVASAIIQSAASAPGVAICEMRDESVRNMIIAAQPSLEVVASLAAAVAASTAHTRIGDELTALYQPIMLTARVTGETQALLSTIAIHTMNPEYVSGLTQSLSGLAEASAAVWKSVPRLANTQDAVLSGWLLEAPVVQTYEAARSIAYIAGVEEHSDLDFGEPIVRYRPEPADVAAKIEAVGEEFIVLYDAAVDAVDSLRPDYARQAAAALRELLDHLLRRLAPNSEVKAHPEYAALLPTQSRKARLRFLFRNVLDGAYAEFVEKDIDLILQTFNALHKAVHTLENPYTEAEVRLLLTRVTGNIAMILVVAQSQIDGQSAWN